MKKKSLNQIESEIQSIKSQLLEIGNMRPGSLTKQYRHPDKQTGAFFQLSYTHQMKSKTEYVRPEFVEETRQQILNYKKFKKLIEKWIALGILYSQVSMKFEIERKAQHRKRKPKETS